MKITTHTTTTSTRKQVFSSNNKFQIESFRKQVTFKQVSNRSQAKDCNHPIATIACDINTLSTCITRYIHGLRFILHQNLTPNELEYPPGVSVLLMFSG